MSDSPDYLHERRQEILDGRRSWNKDDHALGDADVFYTHIVVPLRELRDQGLFEGLHEARGSRRGSTRIDRVDIRRPIARVSIRADVFGRGILCNNAGEAAAVNAWNCLTSGMGPTWFSYANH